LPPARVRVIPNPVTADFSIVASGLPDGSARAEIIDVLGRRLATLATAAVRGTVRFHSGSLKLPPGRYVVRIASTGATTALTVL
jgi:hypothetical protein